jgi:hypothetical protein
VVEPVERPRERGAREVHAVQPPVALAHHEPRALEHAHVPRDGRRRHLERLGELADGGRAGRKALQHMAASGVGERREHGVERVDVTINHMVNYKHCPWRAAREEIARGRCVTLATAGA